MEDNKKVHDFDFIGRILDILRILKEETDEYTTISQPEILRLMEEHEHPCSARTLTDYLKVIMRELNPEDEDGYVDDRFTISDYKIIPKGLDEKLYARFNMDKLGGVYVAKGNTKLGKSIDGATAAYSPIRKSLLINNKSLKNPDVFLKSRKEELEIIKKYKEDPSAYTFKTKRAEDVAKASLVSGRATVPDTVEDVINHEMGHSIEKIVAKADGYETVKANMSKYADKISGYATINESEYIAESFASYIKGEGLIDPNLEKIFKGLERNG